jgi:rubrerythrin
MHAGFTTASRLLEGLSLKELLLLALRIEKRCADLLDDLAARVAEPALAKKIARMADDERHHARLLTELDSVTPWPALLSVTERELAEMMRAQVPVLAIELEGAVAANAAISIVTQLEEESASAYRRLAGLREEPAAKELFLRIGDAEANHLQHFLREPAR